MFIRNHKNQPYIEVVDLRSERKEYLKLCNGKSGKFKSYTDWQNYISSLLKKFSSLDDLYNFKRYCINQDRIFSNSPELFGSYVILLITLILDELFYGIPIWALAFMFLASAWWGIKQHKEVIKESCFFRDVIEIVEKIEDELKEV